MLTTRPQITFDPHNPEHVLCIKRLLENNRIDPQFRFHVEEGYQTVTGMALHKMAKLWMNKVEAENPKVKVLVETVSEAVKDSGTIVQFRKTAPAAQ
jgi:hypothetical protein